MLPQFGKFQPGKELRAGFWEYKPRAKLVRLQDHGLLEKRGLRGTGDGQWLAVLS